MSEQSVASFATVIQKNETTIDLRKKDGCSKLLKILSLKLLLPLLINRTSLSELF